jgi:hypothetical protein
MPKILGGGVVCTIVMATRPLNTTLAYDPKAKEYNTFYNHVYKDYQPLTPYACTVGTEKVFLFLFFQAFPKQVQAQRDHKRRTPRV